MGQRKIFEEITKIAKNCVKTQIYRFKKLNKPQDEKTIYTMYIIDKLLRTKDNVKSH